MLIDGFGSSKLMLCSFEPDGDIFYDYLCLIGEGIMSLLDASTFEILEHLVDVSSGDPVVSCKRVMVFSPPTSSHQIPCRYSMDYGIMFRFCIANTKLDTRPGSAQYKFIEYCLSSIALA